VRTSASEDPPLVQNMFALNKRPLSLTADVLYGQHLIHFVDRSVDEHWAL